MNLIEALNWRYAVREFSEKKLPVSIINELIECTRLSASSYGLQPYRLITIESEETKRALLPHAMGQTKVHECSHLFVLARLNDIDGRFIDSHFTRVEKERGLSPGSLSGFKDHVRETLLWMTVSELEQWAECQIHIALGNLLTAAAIKQVDACPMAGFDKKGFDEVLKLNENGLSSSVICALGERSNSDASRNDKKVRLPISDFSMSI
ncbi:NAD(P)H-dependent oxidoreductase [Alteromonas gracilis]|uniref:NAD(P)H-dependent oxidoreductase n=1 Tax=Alteromonas gracilis TaxID=1479524 RepID=UPI0030CFDB39